MDRYKWILFDADHTLFDFDKASEEALSEVLRPHGVDWREGMYSEYKRINLQCWAEHEQGIIDRDTLVYERFKRYFDHVNLDLDPVTTQHAYLNNLGTKPYLIRGAEEILSWMQGRFRLGYITNGMTDVQRPRLEMIGWHLKFDAIIIAGEIGVSKPHHAYFNFVHQEIGVPDKNSVLVVGDSLTADIEGAAAFGYRTCWFNPEGMLCHLEQAPDFTIADFEELKQILS